MTTATTPAAPTTRWTALRSVLEEQRADCLRQRESALAETVASLPDPVAVARTATLLRTVEEVDAALARMDDGTYGRCVSCGTDIPEERLEFRPYAATCVACSQR
ncbi:TraR/DksA family transcriptional regulator [Trujillonella endophytica]|uniref:Transcriptional regulator, TraR/DksA family n=1 Tax=Trujillonella endophytica TaxID=673521 RepID=A0A1H8UHP3_9ACTN|nr:TraR/DksA C4-type zinc finger protein [Trujillella endophytica]SEP02705.1 transcriptional regulator, TraR/DksA family [Trujillella endophytica]